MIIERVGKSFGPKIGDLGYGSVITGVKNNSDCVYIKIRKHKCGVGVSVNYSKNYCVLVNLEHGTLREIHGDTEVIVLDAKLAVIEAVHPNHYKK